MEQLSLSCISFVSCFCDLRLPAAQLHHYQLWDSISINTGLILLLHICMQTHEKQNCVLK